MRDISANTKHRTPCKKAGCITFSRREPGIVAAVLLALLPKCPFCYMAFSGTLMLCGNGVGMYTHTFSSTPTLVYSFIFCLMILLFIMLNFRDRRTLYAVAVAMLGSAAVIYADTARGGILLYYSGVSVIAFGIWLNTNLFGLIEKFRKHFPHQRDEPGELNRLDADFFK